MEGYKVDFSSLAWESPIEGVRQKTVTDGRKRLRLVEYSRAMPAHWCDKGHVGLILEGRLEIEFERDTYILEKGDGLLIPDGEAHKHKARVLSDVVEVILVEDA